MRRPLLVLASSLVVLTACGGATDVVTGEPSGNSFANAPLNDDPAVPVLQVTPVCYGACTYVNLLGLPDVVLYGDGRVVRSTRALPDPRPALSTGQVPTARVRELVALAAQAGLTGGGRSALPRPENVSDGGGDVLTARLDGNVTTVESPFAYDNPERPGFERNSPESNQRQTLRQIAEALRRTEATTPYARDRVVLRAEPSPDEQPDAVVWTGPRFADLPVDGVGRCAVLTGEPGQAALDAVRQDAFPTVYLEDGAQLRVQARPALPHEDTCADVAETVRTSTGS